MDNLDTIVPLYCTLYDWWEDYNNQNFMNKVYNEETDLSTAGILEIL